MAIEVVDFPIKNGDFPWLCWITRWYHIIIHDIISSHHSDLGKWGSTPWDGMVSYSILIDTTRLEAEISRVQKLSPTGPPGWIFPPFFFTHVQWRCIYLDIWLQMVTSVNNIWIHSEKIIIYIYNYICCQCYVTICIPIFQWCIQIYIYICWNAILNNISATSPGMSGHLITMMRQPEQRVLSAYHDARFDHGASRYPNVCHADGVGDWSDFDGFWWILMDFMSLRMQIYGHSLAYYFSSPLLDW